MKKWVLFLFAIALPGIAMLTSWTASASESSDRGKYLVEGVAMCVDCHSPRDERGQFDQAAWLQGAPLPFKPSVPMPVWADVAPPIAGLPGWKDEEVVKLLTTGKTPSGEALKPPMPEYRMNEDDAKAVVTYLRSLDDSKK